MMKIVCNNKIATSSLLLLLFCAFCLFGSCHSANTIRGSSSSTTTFFDYSYNDGEATQKRELKSLEIIGSDPSVKLTRCQGDCDDDSE